ETFEKSPRHHAGYGNLEVVEGDGVYLANVEWTPAGEEFAPDYRDLSPALLVDDGNRVTGITSVAIVTNGGLQDGHTLLRAVRLEAPKPKGKDEGKDADDAGEPPAPPEGEPPAEDPPPAGNPPADDPPDDDPEPTLDDLAKKVFGIESAMNERTAALDKTLASINERLAVIEKAMATQKETLAAKKPEPDAEAVRLAAEKESARLAAEAAEKDAARERAHLVQMAVAAGKAVTLPEAVLSRMTPDETRAYLATLPAKLPTGSAVRAAGPERPAFAAPGQEREDARSLLVAQVRRDHPDFDFNRAWTEARRARPDLFRNERETI
ncbi:MAG: hypothetical protein ILO10_04535, partial [Kiritimatiellae bacterium]|nr:hypothetical protein [Kiritimatiellia bacterium]